MLPLNVPAAEFVMRLAQARGVGPTIRVRVIAGGCSGLTWDLVLGDEQRPGDHRRVTEGVTVLVDAPSAKYLRGARLELGTPPTTVLRPPLVETQGGPAVIVAGLMAKHVCGCGESFVPA